MNINELLRTRPENLASKQEEVLNEAVVDRLRLIADLIEKRKYSDVEKYLFDSPAGDGYGLDNTAISFTDIYDPSCQGLDSDIGDMIEKLNELSRLHK